MLEICLFSSLMARANYAIVGTETLRLPVFSFFYVLETSIFLVLFCLSEATTTIGFSGVSSFPLQGDEASEIVLESDSAYGITV